MTAMCDSAKHRSTEYTCPNCGQNKEWSVRKGMLKLNEWKICIPNPFQNCQRIYPIQQKKVSRLIDELTKNDANIKKIIIFGSSVTARCHVGSDVDVYVETNAEPKDLIKDFVPFAYDLWTDMTADQRLKTEILKTGVVVYE